MNRIALVLAGALLAGTVAAQEAAPKEKIRTFTFGQGEPGPLASPNFDLMFQREALPAQVEFFSTEISAIVCSVRSCSATGCWVMMSAAWPRRTAA